MPVTRFPSWEGWQLELPEWVRSGTTNRPEGQTALSPSGRGFPAALPFLPAITFHEVPAKATRSARAAYTCAICFR